jgi:thiamine biosynthesis lipoprotein
MLGFARSAISAVAFVSSFLAPPALARYEYAQPHMGTEVRIVLYAPTPAAAADASQAAFARIAQLDDELSDYRESSELTRLSRQAGGAPVKVSDDLFRVLRASQQLYRRSDGAFDATVGPLSVIWRRARRLSEMPDPARLADARTLVGSDRLELDGDRRTARLATPGMRLDLGGIAKGFAADEAAAVLKERGIGAALVAAGGDIVVTDPPPGADGWRVAIAAGFDVSPPRHLILHHTAVSTSGDAEQFVTLDGVRYSHIIDPRTGMAITGRSSVTIVAPNGTTSDSLATAVAVLGWEKGLRLVDSTPGVAGLVMEAAAGGVHTHESAAWANVVSARRTVGSAFRRTERRSRPAMGASGFSRTINRRALRALGRWSSSRDTASPRTIDPGRRPTRIRAA